MRNDCEVIYETFHILNCGFQKSGRIPVSNWCRRSRSGSGVYIIYNGPHAFLLHLPTPSSYPNFCSFFYHRDNNCSRFEKVPRSNHSLKKICVSFSIVTPKNGFKEDKRARTCRPTYAFPFGSTFPRVKGKRVTS